MLIHICAMAWWLESLTGNRVVTGSNRSEAVWKLFFFNLRYPTLFCQCLSEETLPFLRCAIIGNVQVNWPKLFQDFSVKFTR